jgi:hypothetical protein
MLRAKCLVLAVKEKLIICGITASMEKKGSKATCCVYSSV